MAAAFNSLLVVVLVFSTFTSCAGDDNQPSISDSAYTIALHEYQSAKQALEETIVRCESGSKPIPADLIAPLDLSPDQLKVALYTLNARAEARCEQGTREHFFYAAGVYRAVAKHYGKDPGDASQYDEENMLSHLWKQKEFEAKYQRIDKEKRSKLENIDALQAPFKIFETLDALN